MMMLVLFPQKKMSMSSSKASIRYAWQLSLIVSLRVIGIMAFLPAIVDCIRAYAGQTPFLMGIAIGIYGAAQLIGQFTLAALSDRLGRKPMVILGLMLMLLGSLLGWHAKSIHMLIIARCLQGLGAIGSTCMSWLLDIAHPNERTSVFMIFGMSIGLAFISAMTLGAKLSSLYGMGGIFAFSTFASLMSFVVILPLPSPLTSRASMTNINAKQHQRKLFALLCISIFVIHAIFSVFVTSFALSLKSLMVKPSIFYGLNMLSAGILAAYLVRKIDKKIGRKPLILLILQLTMLCAVHVYHLPPTLFTLALSYFFFMFAFSSLESILPSMIPLCTSSRRRGACTGIFSSAQYAGVSLGGLCAGLFHHQINRAILFMLVLLIVSTLAAGWMHRMRHHLLGDCSSTSSANDATMA